MHSTSPFSCGNWGYTPCEVNWVGFTYQARLLSDGGRLNLLDWVAHLGDLVDAVVVGDGSRDGTNKELGVGLSLPLAIVDTGRGGQGGDGGVGALSGGHVLADILGDNLVAGNLDLVALGDGLGHTALSLHFLKLGGAGGGVVGDIGDRVGEGVAGVEEGVGLRGRHGRGEAGKEENLREVKIYWGRGQHIAVTSESIYLGNGQAARKRVTWSMVRLCFLRGRVATPRWQAALLNPAITLGWISTGRGSGTNYYSFITQSNPTG